MLEQLLVVFDQFDTDENLRVIVLRASGSTFCAGVDLKEMLQDRDVHGTVEHELLERVFTRFEEHRNPIIAEVQGPALAGGCELALHCDIRVASPNAAFGMPLARIGIVVPFALGRRLTALAGAGVAGDLLLSGEPIDATRALHCGVITRLESTEDLAVKTRALAELIATNAPLAVRAMKRVVRWTDRRSVV